MLYKKWISHYGFLQKMWPNLQFPEDLVKFTEEILNRKVHLLCSETTEILFSVRYFEHMEATIKPNLDIGPLLSKLLQKITHTPWWCHMNTITRCISQSIYDTYFQPPNIYLLKVGKWYTTKCVKSVHFTFILQVFSLFTLNK